MSTHFLHISVTHDLPYRRIRLSLRPPVSSLIKSKLNNCNSLFISIDTTHIKNVYRTSTNLWPTSQDYQSFSLLPVYSYAYTFKLKTTVIIKSIHDSLLFLFLAASTRNHRLYNRLLSVHPLNLLHFYLEPKPLHHRSRCHLTSLNKTDVLVLALLVTEEM